MIGFVVLGVLLFFTSDVDAAARRTDDVGAEELITVVTLFRHGDRAPKLSIPKIKYSHASYWPMGLGELTQFGIQRLYSLGQWLRKRYDALLSPIYHAGEIYVRSTDRDRALMSAYANLAGLYPPKGFQLWDSGVAWQPIPVHTVPRDIDDVIVEKRTCPKYDALLKDTINSDYYIEINEKNADLYKNMSEWTGFEVKDVTDINLIHSTLTSMKHYNLSYLPQWEKYVDWDLLEFLNGLKYKRYTTTLSMKRLRSGPFIDYIFKHMDKAISPDQSSSVPKMLMISAHGTTLSIILNSMGVFDGHLPGSAFTVLWELKRTQCGRYFVNLYLKSDSDLKKLAVRGCEFECSYENFKSALSNITLDIDSWIKECYEC
ncbi:unnamed protein product [Acanthoscelides obtectus]|uniref:acid phosphatase n=1 Tax=Acanthoscelides obtectus TaxID=200917 RepID=A0A9P0PDA9_ACAOB|nr:unnamed protein product [Acanthoscelides obtectus]CAK1659096.1 Lysosomal acid phosphatase [Acanthoscelides obtectus]